MTDGRHHLPKDLVHILGHQKLKGNYVNSTISFQASIMWTCIHASILPIADLGNIVYILSNKLIMVGCHMFRVQFPVAMMWKALKQRSWTVTCRCNGGRETLTFHHNHHNRKSSNRREIMFQRGCFIIVHLTKYFSWNIKGSYVKKNDTYLN